MKNLFEDLFVLELANNHLGDFDRAKEMILQCAQIAHKFSAKVAIKFQLRDAKNFVHKDFCDRDDIRYVRKVLDTILTNDEYKRLYDIAREQGFLTMATPFDETAVQMCKDFDIDIIKIASSDIKNITLLKKIAELKKPVIASLGGAQIDECDNLVSYFELNSIPLALNYCVSLYPTKNEDLNLSEISMLKDRYCGHFVGFSTHQEQKNLKYSIPSAVALGARMIERHVDIEFKGKMRLDYCSKPQELAEIFEAYFEAKKMCEKTNAKKLLVFEKQKEILKKFTRGAWATRDLSAGDKIKQEDFYFAIPYQNGQLSHNDFVCNQILKCDIKKDKPILLENIQI